MMNVWYVTQGEDSRRGGPTKEAEREEAAAAAAGEEVQATAIGSLVAPGALL